ncbi:molybdenum cofactor guanylyltransferase [Sunxiuqinia indica]|uniref:molybdenum cofactor guanylyltransferase n=1 Tax=Sunxiuqinia indica TaxID=2692584 RepID=UPI00135764D0|nr:molybdenum cofactor guanylyltransferase [Sunxiuqinia indica]
MALTGIILAGGKSSRMGQDKALIDYQGKKLIEYAIDLLRPLCSHMLISANQSGYDQFGLTVVNDVYPDCGPIGGLHAALSGSKTDWNIVVSCDTPNLNSLLFQFLLAKKEDAQAIIPKHDKGVEPMAALYNKELIGFLEEKIKHGDLKLQKVIREIPVRFVDVSSVLQKFPDLFLNLNRPEDLNQK